MPIYEFHCRKCDKDSEVLVRSSDWAGTECLHCGSTRLEKKFSTFAASTAGEGAEAAACGMGNGGGGGGCCGCASGRPHSH